MAEEPIVDENLEKIEEMFEQPTLRDRLRKLFTGLGKPRSSREYKEAIVELQRLLAPVVAILIPGILIAILIVCAAPGKSNKALSDIQIAQAEDEEVIEEQQDQETPEVEMEDLATEAIMDTPANTVNVANPAEAVMPQTQAPTVSSVSEVMDIKAPVMMKNVFGQQRSASGRASALRKFGGDAETERCVMRALRWLVTQQQKDGSWKGSGGASGVSCTGFVILAFLAHGEKPGGSPEFGACLQKAVEYLMRKKKHDAMEMHALAEAYGMTRNPNIKDMLEKDLVALCDRLADKTTWGHPTDGKDYTMPNLLTMTFNVMTLRSAQLSRIKTPKMDRALAKLREGFLGQSNKKMGGFSSDYYGPARFPYRRTGTWHFMMGVVGMQYLGYGDHPVIEKTMQILDDDWAPPTLKWSDIACCPVRGNYWATMVFFNDEGNRNRWKKWNMQMKHVYTRGQKVLGVAESNYVDEKGRPQETGYWRCKDMHIGSQPLMPTCYVAQQLMVYYRYLPTGSKEAWNVTEEKKVEATQSDDITVGIGDL